MKILQINTVCGSGSVGKITADIYNTLKEQGEEGVVCYGRNSAPKEINAVKVGSKWDFYFHALVGVLFGRGGFGSGKMTDKLIEKIKEEQPDIIHLHNIHGFYLQVEKLFSYLKKADIPVVWTLHDCWSFTGHCAYFDYVSCEKWKDGCSSCPQHINAYPYSLMDYSKKSYERKKEAFCGVKNLTIVTPSKWLKDLVLKSVLKEYPVKVIPNGIELKNFNDRETVEQNNFRKQYGIENKYMILGVANVWEKRKGMEYFIELSKMLEEKNREINQENAVIVLVGVSKKEKDGLPKNIIGIERTNGAKELADIYRTADVYVNATLEDNFPTTNLEALACGTPVITFATGGSTESIDGSCGMITKEKSAKGIYEALLELQRNPKDREKCAKKGKEYDKKIRFLQYIQLYKELMQ